jgi:NTP pyrophosphatase (non-canonical NTP hydrolase)
MSITPDEYQRLALLTAHTPDFVRLEGRSHEHNVLVAAAIHACLGMASEVGEIADALKKHLIYGRELDLINLVEESGDVSWYQALMLTALKKTMTEAFEKNIAKLRQRFGDAFSEAKAINRDINAERRELER